MNASNSVQYVPSLPQTFEQWFRHLNERGVYLLQQSKNVAKVQQQINNLVTSNAALSQNAVWVQPFLNQRQLIPFIIQYQSGGNQQLFSFLALKYHNEFMFYNNYYLFVMKQLNISLPSQAPGRKDRRDRMEEQRVKQEHRRKRLQQQKQAKLQFQRKQLLRKQQERKRLKAQSMRPILVPFTLHSFEAFLALFDDLVTQDHCLHPLLLKDIVNYKNRKIQTQLLNEAAFLQRYSERKNVKNLTLTKQNSRSSQQIMRGTGVKQTVNVSKVGGLMRAVEDPELLKMRQAIKSEKDFFQKQSQKIKNIQEILRRQAKFKLNQLTPQNFNVLLKDFKALAFQSRLSCQVLVKEIIVMAWHQQKYCSTYAKLCSELDSVKGQQLSSLVLQQQMSKSQNGFHFKLIEQVQTYFDRRTQLPKAVAKEQIQLLLAENKKRKLGNIKFIAELIKLNILKKHVHRHCFVKLLQNYLGQLGEQSTAQDNIEGLIVFFDKIGQHIEKKQKGQAASNQFQQALIKQAQNFAKGGPKQKFMALLKQYEPEKCKISLNGYFSVLGALQKYEKLAYRLKALIKNLLQKKERGWVDAYSNQGPKKLSQIHETQSEQSSLLNSEQIRNRIQSVLQRFVNDMKGMLNGLGKILDDSKPQEMLYVLLTLVCDDKLQNIRFRKNMLSQFISNQKIVKAFLRTWQNKLKSVACLASDQPFLASYLAQTIARLLDRKLIQLSDLKLIFLEEEEEEKQFFQQLMAKISSIDELFQGEVSALLADMNLQASAVQNKRLIGRNRIN